MSRLPRSRRMIVEALEPRLMFSATADIAVLHDSASDVNYLADAAENLDLTQVYDLPDDALIVPADVPDAAVNTEQESSQVNSTAAITETSTPAVSDIALQTAASDVPDSPGLTTTTEPTAPTVDVIDTGLVAMAKADVQSMASQTPNTLAANSPVLVFVDTSVENYEALVKDIQDNNANQNVTIIYLRPDQDGVQQITDALANQTSVAAIHLITHGSAGSFQLGSDDINENTLDQYADELTAWQRSLNADADILIYGCDVASTDAGQQLIAHIGELTHADVAASTNLTGSASRGGDWYLEFHYGTIETNVIFTAQAQESWNSILVADVHYMEQLTGTSSQQFYNNNNVGQQFMITGSGTYTVNQVGVQLKVLPGANYQEMTMLIRSTWNNATNLAMSTNVVASTSLTSDFAWYAFDFSGVTLTKGQNYVIQMYTVYPSNFGATTDGKVAAAYVPNPGVLANTQMVSGINSGTFSGGDLAFIIAFDNGNQTPYLSNALTDQTATEKVAFSYQFNSTDFKDDDFQDKLTYSATLSNGAALPSWLSFDSATRTFSGTPGVNDAGTISVKVTASDGQATTSDTFDIAIANNNVAPTVANAIPDQNATEDSAFNFQFASNAFNDADADPLTYTATLSNGSALPSWLTFNAATRTFSGTPTNSDVGTIAVKVTANDNQGGTISDIFNITTANTNDAPTVANLIPDKNATEDSPFSFQFASNTFADVDVGDTLTYSATLSSGAALPAWLSFNAATRTFSGTPLNADVGTISVKVIANDGNGGTVFDTFDIVIANTNDAPTVANIIPDQNATEDSAFNFQFASNTFNDVDVGNTLSYTATLSGGGALPSWLTFNAATRTFSGTPTNSDVGTISIQVTANDSQGGTVSDTFDIVVANTNDAPTVANLIPDKNATEDVAFNFQFASNTFADVDVGDTLTYTATLAGGGALPAWLNFNAATRTFSGTPLNADVGTISVKVTANDGNGGTVFDTFDIVVTNTNDAPTVANTIPDQNATQDSPFNFQFASNSFDDVDVGDTLTYTATLSGGGALPAWLNFDANTRTFSGTPLSTHVGTISVQVTANDGHGGTINDTFDIVVANINDAPVVSTPIPDRSVVKLNPFNYQVAANAFTDIDGDTLTYSAQLSGGGALPSWLTFNAATRTFSGTPQPGDVGTIAVEVTASDGSLSVSDTFNITVTNTNFAPTVANAIPDQNATEDSAFSFQFASNTFNDVDGDPLNYTAQLSGGGALPSWLTFNAATRTFSGTPVNGDVGTISVEVIADDGNVTVSDTFDIVIANTNDAPTVANAIPDQNATEDAAFNFQFPANTFNDVDVGATLTYTAQLSGGGALPAWLSFNAATRTFSGTPTNADVGTLSIQVIADDGLGGTGSDIFNIVIANTNDAPTVANVIPNQNATEDSAFNFQFASNTFNDVDVGDTLTYTATLSGGGALPSWLSFNAATRTFSGTPTNANVGTISIEVTADDGNGGTIADTFDIVITNTNDAPTVANIIPDQNATEDAAFNYQFPANTFNDVDVGDTLTYTSTLANGSALPAWLSFNAATRTFSGTPTNADVGTISIKVVADDGNGGTVFDTFDIVIANTNDAPTVANTIPNQNATEDSAFNFQFASNTFNDVDVGNTLTYSATLSGGGALPSWLTFNAATRTFSGTPTNLDVGTISIEVTANDSQGGIVSDTFDIVIANTNDAPTVANPIPDQAAVEDSAFNFQFASNTFDDVDVGDTLTYTSTLANGSALPAWLSFNAATRTFSGTPTNADVGTISIKVVADDGNGGTVFDTFDLVIANTNDAPTVANLIPDQNATEDSAFNFQFSSNTFHDVDAGNTLTYSATLSGGGGLPSWLSFNATTRTFSGTPTNADVGAISIRVTADDNQGGIVSDVFTLVIANANDAPTVANPIPDQNATQDSPFSFQFASNSFDDIDAGATLTYTAQVGGEPLPSWLSFDANTRTFSGTPLNADVGTLSVQVIADDGQGGTVIDTFDIVIANTNDEPTVANAIPNQNATEDSAFNFQFASNTFNDVDVGDTLTYTATLSSGGTLPAWLSFNAATRTFSGTPDNNDVGTLSITVTADDGNGGTITDTFNITVLNSNDVPTVANAIPHQNATEDATFTFQIPSNTFNDVDVGDTLTYTSTLSNGSSLPSWLSFDANTRTLSGTPLNTDVGTLSIKVIANDGHGGTVFNTFDIVIANTNDAPVIANPIENKTIASNQLFSFVIPTNTFHDDDVGDALTYSVHLSNGNPLPAWLTFDENTRTLSGTPPKDAVNTLLKVEITATDNSGSSVSDTFEIFVDKEATVYTPETPTKTIPKPSTPSTPELPTPITPVERHDTSTDDTTTSTHDSSNALDITENNLPLLLSLNEETSVEDKNNVRLMDIRNTLSMANSSPLLAGLITPDSGFTTSDTEDFNNALRRLHDDMNQVLDAESLQKSIIAGITFSVTTGAIIWSLRASSLLLTLMSMVPLWGSMDPLPILDKVNKRKEELKQQLKDKQKEDENAEEVGYLFDQTHSAKNKSSE